MEAYDIFINFYYALDYIFDLTHSKELGYYLSGANPFLFEGEGSADPAIYDEFKQSFIVKFGGKCISKETAYNWLSEYTNILGNDAVKRAFAKITLTMWLDAVE